VASWVGDRLCLGGTYIIGSVDPELLEGGMASHFLGGEGCESGDERRLHDGLRRKVVVSDARCVTKLVRGYDPSQS
jgi:hypothetical protein